MSRYVVWVGQNFNMLQVWLAATVQKQWLATTIQTDSPPSYCYWQSVYINAKIVFCVLGSAPGQTGLTPSQTKDKFLELIIVWHLLIGSVDLFQVHHFTVSLFSCTWVRSVCYTLLLITIRWHTCFYYSQGCVAHDDYILDILQRQSAIFVRGVAPIFVWDTVYLESNPHNLLKSSIACYWHHLHISSIDCQDNHCHPHLLSLLWTA